MTSASWAQSIDDIRYGRQDDATRIVMDMTSKSSYTFQTLASPPRLVIDLDQNYNVPAGIKADPTGRIKTVRQGPLPDGGLRLVYDLHTPINVNKHFYIAPSSTNSKYRLVFDVVPQPTVSQIEQPTIIIEENIITPNPQYMDAVNIPPLPTPKPFVYEMPFKKYTVVIDAGHGGGDPGSLSHDKKREKDIVLSIAKKIQAELKRSGRYEVHLTRESDYYIQLRDRFKKARDVKADFFVSIHADKIHIPSVRGASVYTLSETASDKETARLARQENNAGVVAGVDLGVEEEDVANILLDLVRRETLNESKLFAELFVQSIKDHGIKHLNNPHRYAGFAVLKAPDVPSVLIESGFLSNKQDAALLQSDSYQNDLAKSIHSAMDRFFDRLERLNSE